MSADHNQEFRAKPWPQSTPTTEKEFERLMGASSTAGQPENSTASQSDLPPLPGLDVPVADAAASAQTFSYEENVANKDPLADSDKSLTEDIAGPFTHSRLTALLSAIPSGSAGSGFNANSSTGQTFHSGLYIPASLPGNDPVPAPQPKQAFAPSPGTSRATQLFSGDLPGMEVRQVQSGPSEYTRVVHGSASRSAKENPDLPPASANSSSGNNVPPLHPVASAPPPSWPLVNPAAIAFPQVPSVPVPSVSSIPNPNLWPMQVPVVQPPVVTPPPPPQVSPEPPRQGSLLMTYLPLIIFFNFLLILAIVFILFFAFRK